MAQCSFAPLDHHVAGNNYNYYPQMAYAHGYYPVQGARRASTPSSSSTLSVTDDTPALQYAPMPAYHLQVQQQQQQLYSAAPMNPSPPHMASIAPTGPPPLTVMHNLQTPPMPARVPSLGVPPPEPAFNHIAESAPPPRKRKPHTRTKTGCRRCRLQRVKCPEGPVSINGRQIVCRRCWETDRPCFYPTPAAQQARGKNERDCAEAWERAEDVDEWHWGNGVAGGGRAVSTTSTALEIAQMFPAQSHPSQHPGHVSLLDEYESEQEPLPMHITKVVQHPLVSQQSMLLSPISQADQLPLVDQHPPALSPAFLHHLLAPSPLSGLVTNLSLTALSGQSVGNIDRQVVSYFENEGCHEIVSTTMNKHNWIFTQLFPRLFSTLSLPPCPEDDVSGAIRQWLHYCLLQICYVHRANIEKDDERSYHWRAEATKWRQKASYAILKAKVKFPEGQWKTEEYLMGFFVRCMADMLDSGHLNLDQTTVFELPVESASPFYPSLRDMIALYSTLQFSCANLDAVVGCSPLFEISAEGPEWVERFVGFSRRIIILLGQVTGMVVYRHNLIRAGTDRGAPGKLLRAQAERLANQLGESWNWDESTQEVGCNLRIRRGNEVMRSALLVLVLTEVLNVDLSDPRIEAAAARVIELVADQEPNGISGFQWPLTILAIYSVRQDHRERLQNLIQQVIALSFGRGYKGPEDIIQLCWEALDRNGAYENGIAPWRVAMGALGRNMFI